MRRIALFRQSLPLFYTKAVLLVCDNKAQFRKFHTLSEKSVSAHCKLDRAIPQAG